MTMDSMAANQGMFGEYGLNMTGMGMNMEMNYNGQSMYGSLGWNGFQQDMWQGGQDNFNPSAFANGADSLHLAGLIRLIPLTLARSLVSTARGMVEVPFEVVAVVISRVDLAAEASVAPVTLMFLILGSPPSQG